MEKFNMKQLFGGFGVMFMVLFLLIVAGSFQGSNQLATTITEPLNSKLNIPLDKTGEYKNPPQPANVITGTFNPASPGNVVYRDEANPNRKFHYKAIHSDRLKGNDLQPVLKLQVMRGSLASWKDTQWSWIDSDQGILYFFYADEENGTIKPADDFSGDYQLIINL